MRRLLAVATLALCPAPAAALEACPGEPAQVNVVLAGQGTLESVITDPAGRLFFTSPQGLMRLDAREAAPRLLTPIAGGGGLAFDADGMLLVGQGNTIANGATGDDTGPSSLLKVDPETGASSVYATGLSMGNGVARAPTGEVFASNDIGSNIDRIVDGRTERGWAQVESGNGLAIDLAGRYLYAAQTFRPAAIARVDLRDPTQVTTFAAPRDPADLTAGLDGMVRDGADRLFVTANAGGQVWRADPDGSLCLVADGLDRFPDGPSAVTTGATRGPFAAANLYVVTFGGDVLEIVGAATPPAQLDIAAARTCRRVTLTVTARGAPVAAADVSFSGLRRSTGPRGRVRFTGPFAARRVTARAQRPGYEPGRKRVRTKRC